MSELCKHPPAACTKGPRVPARYGSWPTEICLVCGKYRLDLPNVRPSPQWEKGPPPTEGDYDDE